MPTKICRVCFEEGNDLRDLGTGTNSCGFKLSSCVPEINVYVVDNPKICMPCFCMVQVAYKLRESCLENEKNFNPSFDRTDYAFNKKLPQIKKENGEKEQPENKEVNVVFNDFFDESGSINIDSNQILKTERLSFHDDERPIDMVPHIKTEVFDSTDNLLEVSEEYITTVSHDNFVSRTNAEGVSEFACNMCNKTFTELRYLKVHLKRKHYTEKRKNVKFECNHCYKSFTTRAGLMVHGKSCRKMRNKDTNADASSSAPNDETEAKSVVKSGGETFPCEKCFKVFTTRASFRVHSKHCSEELLNDSKEHLAASVLTVNPLLIAAELEGGGRKKTDDVFDSNSDGGIDSDYDPPYKGSDTPDDGDSDGSDFSLSNRRKRKSRGRNSWGISTDQYRRKRIDLQIKCENCSRTFATKSAIINHSRSCMQSTQEILPQQFEYTIDPNEVGENNSGIPETFDYTIDPNEVGENNEGLPQTFEYTIDPNEIGENNKGEYDCKICEEKFTDEKLLEEHIATHISQSTATVAASSQSNAECQTVVCCDEEYTTVSLLQLHTYKEHGKSCGVCNKHYTCYNELFAHLLEHTKG